MGTTPLKLEGASGDLKEMTTAEENYLAYQAGLQLAAMADTDVGALTKTSGGTTVGTFSDTFYNQAVGTHPGTSLSIGTTNYTFYQNTGTAAETSGDFHRPIQWDNTLDGIQEMDDTDFNTCVDRLLSTIVANEYPGVYRLAASAPSADWDLHISNVYTNTQTSGVTATYNIYQRQTYTAPTAVNSIKIESTSPIAIKEMTATEIKTTFGQRAKTRIMASGIGTYQLRTSAQGAPTAPGTWVARGVAYDTRNTTADTAYTRNSTTDFSADYTRNSTSVFTGDFTGDFVGDFAGDFLGDFIGDTNFTRISTRTSTRISQRTSIRTSYNSQGTIQQGVAILTYSRGNRSFVGYFLGDFLGDFAGNFLGDFVGTRNYTRISTRNSTTNFTRNSTTDFTGDFLGNYIGNYIGDFTGNYLGETITSNSTTVETYTLYVRTA